MYIPITIYHLHPDCETQWNVMRWTVSRGILNCVSWCCVLLSFQYCHGFALERTTSLPYCALVSNCIFDGTWFWWWWWGCWWSTKLHLLALHLDPLFQWIGVCSWNWALEQSCFLLLYLFIVQSLRTWVRVRVFFLFYWFQDMGHMTTVSAVCF